MSCEQSRSRAVLSVLAGQSRVPWQCCYVLPPAALQLPSCTRELEKRRYLNIKMCVWQLLATAFLGSPSSKFIWFWKHFTTSQNFSFLQHLNKKAEHKHCPSPSLFHDPLERSSELRAKGRQIIAMLLVKNHRRTGLLFDSTLLFGDNIHFVG